jgi:hypothetical protein
VNAVKNCELKMEAHPKEKRWKGKERSPRKKYKCKRQMESASP